MKVLKHNHYSTFGGGDGFFYAKLVHVLSKNVS